MTQPISLLLCALGGEGGGVLAQWLVDAARRAGYPAQATSIPGVAQRTGATTYYLEVFPVKLADLGGRRPVLGLNPLPGRLDVLLSSELLETARQISLGLASSAHTLVITSSARALTTAEKMDMGDGRRASEGLVSIVRQHSRSHHVVDMASLTRQAGTVVSATMLGCLAASGVLPFERADFEAVITEGGNLNTPATAASVKGFSNGYAAVDAQRSQLAAIEASLSFEEQTIEQIQGQSAHSLPSSVNLAAFPAPVRDMLTLGHARLVDYQGSDYAALYVKRLARVLAAEQQADPAGQQGFTTTREMARWLALWMAFDDIVRVASLKGRASRLTRVVGEVKPKPGDLLQVYDHFKPGIPEFAALLPARMANALLAWDKRRVAHGKSPFALALKIGTHSVLGMLSLRVLASLKFMRVRGSRFAHEQMLIDQWLEAVVKATSLNWSLGHELALCGRMIKGYGSTNERAKHNLQHILTHLAAPATAANAATQAKAVAAAREAALTDEAGSALDKALVQHGAPARPLVAQPIRWVKKPPGQAVAAKRA
jgi:indolepyruvate ferredoxin oxidoreductase, beta subunit